MENSNLLYLLRTFSPSEWKAFDKYLRSPYLNSNKRLLPFYAYLKKYHPAFEHKQLAKPVIFAALFPEKENFDDKLLRAAMSDLHKATLRFLAFHELGESDILQKELLAKRFAKKDEYEKFKNLSLEILILKEKEAGPIHGLEYYYKKFEAYNNLYFFPGKAGYKISPEHLEKAHENLYAFFSMANERILIEKADRNTRFNIKEKKAVSEKKDLYFLSERASLNKKLLDLLKNKRGNHDYFLEIKNGYIGHFDTLDLFDKKFIFQKFQNYINKEFINGKSDYLQELLSLYKFGLAKKLFLYESEINDNVFINIAVTGASCKDFNWTDKFIHRYAAYLNLNLQEDAFNFAKASLKFNQGIFSECIDLLAGISPKNIYYKLRVTPLYIRCYFELFLTDDSYAKLLKSKIKAFEKFLERKKFLSEKWTIPYKNFCKATIVLIQLKKPIGLNKLAIKNKYNKREKEKNTINRNWILEKLNDLK